MTAFALIGPCVVAAAAQAAPLRCVMPNGVVVTRSLGDCPADAAAWPEGAPKPPIPRALPAQRPPAAGAGDQAGVGKDGRLPVSAATWPLPWPLAQRAGALSCQPVPGAPQLSVVLFHGADGLTYVLNGLAASRATRHGWHPVTAIWLPNPDIAGTRMPLADMIQRGQALCGP